MIGRRKIVLSSVFAFLSFVLLLSPQQAQAGTILWYNEGVRSGWSGEWTPVLTLLSLAKLLNDAHVSSYTA